MAKLILSLILFIGLIGFSILVGSWGCGLGYCIYISIPLLTFISTIVALISSALLAKKYKISRIKLLLIIPVYIVTSWITGYSSLNYFHYKNLSAFLNKSSNEQKQQRFDHVTPDSVKKVGNNLVYECKACGYKLTFPGDWGFDDFFYGLESNDSWQEFILVTPNFSENSPYQGQRFRVRSLLSNLPNTEFEAAQKSYRDTTLSEITVSGIKGQILKVHKGKVVIPPNEALVRFSSKSHKFEIIAGYENEAEFDKNLKIILNNFEFIN